MKMVINTSIMMKKDWLVGLKITFLLKISSPEFETLICSIIKSNFVFFQDRYISYGLGIVTVVAVIVSRFKLGSDLKVLIILSVVNIFPRYDFLQSKI